MKWSSAKVRALWTIDVVTGLNWSPKRSAVLYANVPSTASGDLHSQLDRLSPVNSVRTSLNWDSVMSRFLLFSIDPTRQGELNVYRLYQVKATVPPMPKLVAERASLLVPYRPKYLLLHLRLRLHADVL